MAKYRKIPVVIEAVRWTGNNEREVFDFLTQTKDKTIDLRGENFRIDLCNGGCQVGDLYIKTLNGEVKADIGEYICRGVKGEYYPCKADIFDMTYEKVEDKNSVIINNFKLKNEEAKALIEFMGELSLGIIGKINDTYDIGSKDIKLVAKGIEKIYSRLKLTDDEVDEKEIEQFEFLNELEDKLKGLWRD
ncbi:hypothetical protein [Metaclostridioides mangenotii]|uniref:Uncharacterized protein n=1 Tax=Metaclostridioides mangenotii TaxID=1540 RepID=A0ABS4E9P7_9FIRM|nr:hypothetical protein [Clostridioides mangenotii]MBP1854670.1 hypothetical protein [Clostridioides mangenotii]